MNRNGWSIASTGMNDWLNEPEWMIHGMNKNKRFGEWAGINDSLNAQESMIWWMNMNEWFIEWTGMKNH